MGATYGNIGLLFITTSGHTAADALVSDVTTLQMCIATLCSYKSRLILGIELQCSDQIKIHYKNSITKGIGVSYSYPPRSLMSTLLVIIKL